MTILPAARPLPKAVAPETAEVAPDQVMLTAQRLAASVPLETSLGPMVESEPPPAEKLQSPADPFREKARQAVTRAGESISQTAWGSLFMEMEPLMVEATALNLFERSLGNNPQAPPQVVVGEAVGAFDLKSLPVSDKARGLARQGEYLSYLTATSGAGPLSPALMAILQDFDTDKLQKLSNNAVATVLTASTSSQSFAHEGVQISGARSDRERENVSEALTYLKERCPKALAACNLVVLESAPMPKGPGTVTNGQTFAHFPTAVLRRSMTDTPESTRWVLFHEIGHLVDNQGGYTDRPDSPFGKGESVTPYGFTDGPQEDFAETHADVLKNWDKIKSNPDLFVHAGGETGAKRAWILREVYGQELPPPSPGCQKFLALESMPGMENSGIEMETLRHTLVASLQNPAKEPVAPGYQAALDWARSYLDPASR